MIVLVPIQVLMILLLEWSLQSWIWVALVPLAFALAANASLWRTTGRGAVAGGLSWLGASLYFYLTSGRIIAGRIAAMFGLGLDRGWLMVIVTGLLGAIIAGLAAFAGASIRAAIRRQIPREEK